MVIEYRTEVIPLRRSCRRSGYVDRQLGLSREDIPKHTDEIWTLFDRVMEKASKVIQKRVLVRLYKELQRKSAETVASGDNLSSHH